ncbi:MAG: hypothetical protein OER95_15135 [Acidimicrobiia bacterium]|nr:hypothetical protein [Acidimicrobiia bacterium]
MTNPPPTPERALAVRRDLEVRRLGLSPGAAALRVEILGASGTAMDGNDPRPDGAPASGWGACDGGPPVLAAASPQVSQ